MSKFCEALWLLDVFFSIQKTNMNQQWSKVNNFIDMFNQREHCIIYDKRLALLTWSINSAILLQQIIYWHWKQWWTFYKFTNKCSHRLYKSWDSWCEELWFTVREFETAIKMIWFKLWKNKNEIEKDSAPVIYYTDSDRVTYYTLNVDILNKLLNVIYLVNADLWITKKTTFQELLFLYKEYTENNNTDEEIAEANESNDSYSDLENTCSSWITIEESKDNDASEQDSCKSQSIGIANQKVTSAKKNKQVDIPPKPNYEYINDYKNLCKEYWILYSKWMWNLADNIVMNSLMRWWKMTKEIAEHAKQVWCWDDLSCLFKKVFSLAGPYQINKLWSLSWFRYNYLTILNSKPKNDTQKCKYKKISEFARMLYEKDCDVTLATEKFLLPYIKVKEMTKTLSEDWRERLYSFNNCDIVMKDSTSWDEEIVMSDEYLTMRLYQKINWNLLKLQLAW